MPGERVHLEEGVTDKREGRPAPAGLRRIIPVAITIVSLGIVAVPVALLAAGHPSAHSRNLHIHNVKLSLPNTTFPRVTSTSNPPKVAPPTVADAKQSLLSALGKTADTSNFDVTYSLATVTPASGGQYAIYNNASITGHGSVQVQPAMTMALTGSVTTSSGNGVSILLGVNSDEIYMGYGSQLPSYDASRWGATPYSLENFAALADGSVGVPLGALGMIGLSNPNGMLDLTQQSITSANAAGSQVVDGLSTTQYDVTIDLNDLTTTPGITPSEKSMIQVSMCSLSTTSLSEKVYVDASGLIRETEMTLPVPNGPTIGLTVHLSDFASAPVPVVPEATSQALLQVPGSPATSGTTTPPAMSSLPAPVQTALGCVGQYMGAASEQGALSMTSMLPPGY